MVMQDRRRVASVVENSAGGDVQQIRGIITKYWPAQHPGVLSEEFKSINMHQKDDFKESSQEVPADQSPQSKNLLQTFNKDD